MIETWENDKAARCVNTERPLAHSLDSGEEGIAMEATRICTVANCDRPQRTRELCGMHYQRLLKTGSTDRPDRPTVCSVPECETRPFGHGWCLKHYTRWRNTGDPLKIRRIPAANLPCSIDGCERIATGRGWCKMHHKRWLRTGDPTMVRPVGYTPPGPSHPSWRGDQITYHTAHRRVTDLRGAASTHACKDCGNPASEWSYDRRDPDEQIGTGKHPYPFSLKAEHYEPRCVSCHRSFDRMARA